ncbi:MAG: ABC transporter ATP-binding protein [Amylibacter sp.]|nr:ABC transporter ATP-binding protein [Amylibacter sp.]
MSEETSEATKDPVLRLRNITRRYPSGDGFLEVLNGADLEINAGEFVGLIGPSGSGKSTLLHAAGLLERPDDGEVWIEGQECLSLRDGERTAVRRNGIGFVYQFHHLLPEFTALDNVAMPLRIAGQGARSARKEAARLLDIMGLSDRVKHQPSQLSGGEQQRVAIARALVNRPRILLADEPTGNLDPNTSAAVFQSLFDLVRIERVAALVATHNHDLQTYMDRILVMQDGKPVTKNPV